MLSCFAIQLWIPVQRPTCAQLAACLFRKRLGMCLDSNSCTNTTKYLSQKLVEKIVVISTPWSYTRTVSKGCLVNPAIKKGIKFSNPFSNLINFGLCPQYCT